jgi:hypothetical protein
LFVIIVFTMPTKRKSSSVSSGGGGSSSKKQKNGLNQRSKPKHALYKYYMIHPDKSFPNKRVDRQKQYYLQDSPYYDFDSKKFKYQMKGYI